jgi:hypothetical protein
MRACVRCGAPCRFLLCDLCYALSVDGDYADVEPYRISDTAIEVSMGVGLPVTVDGLHRF